MQIDQDKLKAILFELRGPTAAYWVASSANIGELNGRVITISVQTKGETDDGDYQGVHPSKLCITE